MIPEQIYQEIADFMNASIQEEWSIAWLEVELKEDFASAIGRYHKPDEQKLYGFRAGEKTVELFTTLREATQRPGHALWQKARFTLQPDGQFDIDFTYPD